MLKVRLLDLKMSFSNGHIFINIIFCELNAFKSVDKIFF